MARRRPYVRSCERASGSGERGVPVELDKQFVLDELKKQGQSQQVQQALAQLPQVIDHQRDAALLEQLGIDPGQLVEKAAQAGIAKL